MLDLGDLLTLIRLVEIEIFDLQKALDGDDDEASNNAGEIIVQVDGLSKKLREMYELNWGGNENYPKYEDFIKDIKKYPPVLGRLASGQQGCACRPECSVGEEASLMKKDRF